MGKGIKKKKEREKKKIVSQTKREEGQRDC